jgi:hypothetical protein
MGQKVRRPYPLFTSPSFQRWKKHRGHDYAVFVDETFRRFFGGDQGDPYGYFTYGGFGLPVAKYERFERDTKPIFERYNRLLSGREEEFKHTSFKRIAFPARLELATRIAKAIERADGFVAGFYTPGEGMLLEQVRTAVMEDRDELPPDTSDLYAKAIQELRETYGGRPGQSGILTTLLHLCVSGFAHMLGSLGAPFKIYYDARERREDAAVKHAIENLAAAIPLMSPEVGDAFRGMEVVPDSRNELGIQIADLMAGETREFFDANRGLMSEGATRRIVTQISDEPFEAMDVMAMEP